MSEGIRGFVGKTTQNDLNQSFPLPLDDNFDPVVVDSISPLDVEMQQATYDTLQPFVPNITEGKIIRVYDGDTVTIAARFKIDEIYIPKLFRYNVRLRGIDSPEMKSKNANEKCLAVKSRDALSGLIMHKMVKLEHVEYDKYGRILANIITEDGLNISDWMLNEGYAVEYDGGTKHRPAEWTEVRIL
jgi:endonuclease YncB( thermonuclease family)